MKNSQDGLLLPVAAGLAVGAAFVSAFALFVPFMLWPPNSDFLESGDRSIVISFSKLETSVSHAEYLAISKERLSGYPVMLNGVRNAKILYEDCFGDISLEIVCQGAPFISTSAHARISVEEARLLVSEYGFRDLCTEKDPYTIRCNLANSNFGLRVQYEGKYYGIGISHVPR